MMETGADEGLESLGIIFIQNCLIACLFVVATL